nr:lysozyme-like protein [uncultured Mediterranean phage uvMED]BAR28946.1 lysozyme-like protein [uncultured Mediterranean phage uvMED]
MPKIPTFQAKGRITAEAGAVRTNIQVSPFQTTAGELSKVAKVAEDYYIKQRDNNDKIAAKKKYYEMKSESDKIIESQKNNGDEFESVSIYRQQFGDYRKQQLSEIKNNRVKKRLETLLDIEQPENIYKIKKNSFEAMERNSNQLYIQEQNVFSVEYTLEKNLNKKKQIQDKQINSALEYKNIHGMGDAWFNKEKNIIISNNIILDVTQEISSNPRQAYLNLQDKNKYIGLDSFKRRKLINEAKSVLVPEIKENYKNFAAAASLGKKVPFDLKFAKEILRPKEYQKIIQEHGALVESVDNVNIINSVNAKDSSQVTDDFIKEAEQKYPVIKAEKIKKIYKDALKNRNEAMAKDPVLFLTQTDDNLKILVEELAAETNPDMIVKKKLALTDVIVQKQIDMGQPNYQVKVMSQSQADSFVEKYMNGDQNMRVVMLQNLNSEFGTYNSQAMLQLSAAGLPVTAELSSFFNNPNITEKFLTFDSKEEQDRLKQFAKDRNINFNTLRKDVRDNLQDFETVAMRGSSFNNSVALEKIDNIVETLTFYTLSNMSANPGKGENAARKDAVSLINNSFNIEETFFVPLIYDGKSIASSADFIAEKAGLIKDFYLQDFDAVAFQSMDEDVTEVELTEAMTDQMKNFGEWRNKSDGSGIIYGIVFNDGSFGPVVNKDGENLEFNFDDTTLSIPGTDKDIDVEIRIKSQKLDPRGAYPAIPESIKRQEENKQVKLTRTR